MVYNTGYSYTIYSTYKHYTLLVQLHHYCSGYRAHLKIILHIQVIDDVWFSEVSVCLSFLQRKAFGVKANQAVTQWPLFNRFLFTGKEIRKCENANTVKYCK